MFDTRGGLANGLKAVWAPMARCDGLMAAATQVRLVAKPGCNGIGFRQISLKMYIYIINEARKQYSLLDTIFNYIFYLGPPEKYLHV